MINLKFCS